MRPLKPCGCVHSPHMHKIKEEEGKKRNISQCTEKFNLVKKDLRSKSKVKVLDV